MGIKVGFLEEVIYKLESVGLIRFGVSTRKQRKLLCMKISQKKETPHRNWGERKKDLITKIMKTWSTPPKTNVLGILNWKRLPRLHVTSNITPTAANMDSKLWKMS